MARGFDGHDRHDAGVDASGPTGGTATPPWFDDFLIDRAARKPSTHTMKAYRQDFLAIADLLTAGPTVGHHFG
jgi:integrase/recombinase XerC